MKLEMQFHPRSVWYDIWWRWCPGEEIVVQWPSGWIVVDDDGAGGQTAIDSADPNDHYRPALEKLVGRQAWDWDWRIDNVAKDTLRIKFRRRHRAWAAYFAIKWA
jgi:hypothetical protein